MIFITVVLKTDLLVKDSQQKKKRLSTPWFDLFDLLLPWLKANSVVVFFTSFHKLISCVLMKTKGHWSGYFPFHINQYVRMIDCGQ